MAERPPWDHYFMKLAHIAASRSTCERGKVGAILVKDKRVIATGYNGAPHGLPHCTEVGCLVKKVQDHENSLKDHCLRTVHAEQNAIIHAALAGTSSEDSTMYITHHPCFTCAKMIINAGVKRVVFTEHYKDELATQFMKEAGLQVDVLDGFEK